MEALIIVIAFGLIIAGVYGVLSLSRNEGSEEQPAPRLTAGDWVPPRPNLAQPTRPVAGVEPGIGGLFTEVDMLRAQVEHLRSEITALSNEPPKADRSQTRRYQTGPYAYLPRELRREVHKVRSVRHFLHT